MGLLLLQIRKKGSRSIESFPYNHITIDANSIAEKCFEIWGILKMASVKSVEPGNNSFSINHIITCRSKLLPLGFSKFALVLIL